MRIISICGTGNDAREIINLPQVNALIRNICQFMFEAYGSFRIENPLGHYNSSIISSFRRLLNSLSQAMLWKCSKLLQISNEISIKHSR